MNQASGNQGPAGERGSRMFRPGQLLGTDPAGNAQHRQVFEAFMERSPLLAWICDARGSLLYMNRHYRQYLNLDDRALGMSIFDLFPAPFADEYHRNNLNVLAEQRAVESTEHSRNADGTLVVHKAVKFPLQVDGEWLIAGWAVNITEQMSLPEQLAEYEKVKSRLVVKSIVETKEHERHELSATLRDGVNQVLVTCKLLLETALRPDSDPVLHRCSDYLNVAINQIKNISANLNPTTPDDVGLRAAVDHQALQCPTLFQIEWNTEPDALERYGKALTLGVYRIVQKLSRLMAEVPPVGTARVHIGIEQGQLVLRHFAWTDTQRTEVVTKRAFHQIQNRVAYLNGSYHFDGPGNLHIHLPLAGPV